MLTKKWAMVPHDNYMADDQAPIQIVDGDGEVVACNTTFYPTAITRQNAEVIVAAVNATIGTSNDNRCPHTIDLFAEVSA